MPKVTWDQDKVEVRASNFDTLPRGKYPAVVVTSSEKKTGANSASKGAGKYWEFEFEIVKGDFTRRKLWARLNVENPSEVAQNIGRAQFKQLAAACGKEGAKTSEALHGKHVVLLVSIEQGGPRGEQNRVDGFQSPEEWKEQGAVTPTRDDIAESAHRPAPAAGKGGSKGGKQGDFDDDIPF